MKKQNDIPQERDYAFLKSVMVTDPKYTRNVSGAGRPRFTNIDPYWLIEQATKQFGLYGKGFGLDNLNYSILDVGETKVIVLSADFWYVIDGARYSFPITNSDQLAYKTKQGYFKIDTDIYKKLETNTLSKALSKIGFGMDVFLGMFEDQNYINEAFAQHEVISMEQLQTLTKWLTYYGLNVSVVTKHFMISALKELPAENFNEALAIIQKIGEEKKRQKAA